MGEQNDMRRVVLQSGHRLRYCRICMMHQPLRTKHCRDCGRCVRTHDHHCPWVGTCVGEGNRLHFFWFLAEDGMDVPMWLNRSPLLCLGLVLMSLLLVMV